MRNVRVAGPFVRLMGRFVAPCGMRFGMAALLVLALGLISRDDAGARYRSRVDPVVQSGELYVSPTNDALDAVAVSGTTAVAADATPGAAYVFSEPASGWSTEAQVAKLVAPDPLGRAVAISGNTIVVDAPDATVGSNIEEGAVYVFEEPPGGWSGTIGPSAKLIPSDGVRHEGFGSSLGISGSTVVVGASKPGSGSGGYEFTAGVAYVFSEPSVGWAGTLNETAQLVPSGGGELWQLPPVAISGQTVVADGHIGGDGVDYLFREPPTGWAGTVPQRGMLVPSSGNPVGPVQIAGDSIFATGSSTSLCTCSANLIYVFRAPPPGWAGSERQSATLMFNSPPPDGVWVTASPQTAVAATLSGCPRYGACGGSIWTFTEPRGGWSGEILATPGGRISSADGVGIALSGNTAFFAHATDDNPQYGAVSLYTVSGASQFAPPTASRVSLARLARGVPRLHFELSASLSAPAIKAITIKLSAGLTFAHSRKNIRRGVSLGGRRRFTIQRATRGIVLRLDVARGSVSVNVTSPALTESRSLLKRVDALITYNRNKRHRHKKHMRLTVLVTTDDTQNFVVQLPVIIGVP